MQNDVNLISFKAPQKSKSLEARPYVLNENGGWDMVFNLHILSEDKEIELNKEIPVAFMIYDNGTSIKNYNMDDFFSPSTFKCNRNIGLTLLNENYMISNLY